MAASEAKVIELENKLNEMIKKLNAIEEGTTRMSKHIEFIEGVYGTVSAPMYWICNKINRLRGEIKDTTPVQPFDLINKTNTTKLNRLYTTTDDIDKNKKVDVSEQD
tara:strand:- start:302 stop:622 length:321 start_codon:yes stop_codon:yes gene_type:complete